MRTFIDLLMLGLSFFLTTTDQSLREQNFVNTDVVLKEVLVLGADENAAGAYLFGWPVAVHTDAEQRIYVADQTVLGIEQYEVSGKHVRTIGRRGEGPGEFRQITSILVNQQGHLMVADGRQLRMTAFDLTGDVHDTYALRPHNMGAPAQMAHLTPETYLLLYKTEKGARNAHNFSDVNNFFHIFDTAFSEKITTFGPLTDFAPQADAHIERLARLRPGHFWVEATGTVLFAPGIYTGQIYRLQEQDGTWSVLQTLEGAGQNPAFRVLDPVPASRDNPAANLIVRSANQYYSLRSESRGVYTLKDGTIIHFSVQGRPEHASGRSFRVELFAPDGRFIGHDASVDIEGQRLESMRKETFHVLWKDAQDRFYIRESFDVPIIRVVEVAYTTGR